VEIRIREEIRDELLAEQDQHAQQESAADRDRRLVALVISVTMSLACVLPLIALVVGLSWRAFRWASGI